MKSFRRHLKESTLHSLALTHESPLSFVTAALKAIRNKKLKLKTGKGARGVANTRELGSWFVKYKKRQEEKLRSKDKAPSALPPTPPNSYEY